MFVKNCEAQGFKVLVQSAESNDALQNSQAENLLTQGIKCLVVIPHNAKKLRHHRDRGPQDGRARGFL